MALAVTLPFGTGQVMIHHAPKGMVESECKNIPLHSFNNAASATLAFVVGSLSISKDFESREALNSLFLTDDLFNSTVDFGKWNLDQQSKVGDGDSYLVMLESNQGIPKRTYDQTNAFEYLDCQSQ